MKDDGSIYYSGGTEGDDSIRNGDISDMSVDFILHFFQPYEHDKDASKVKCVTVRKYLNM